MDKKFLNRIAKQLNKKSLYKNLTLQTQSIDIAVVSAIRSIQDQVYENDFQKLTTSEDNDNWVKEGVQKLLHITLLYGVEPEEKDKIKEIINKYKNIKIKSVDIDYFDNEKDQHTAVIIKCESEELTKLHEELKASVNNKDKFPTYKPHINMFYFKYKERLENINIPIIEWAIDSFEMSMKDGKLGKI